MQVCPHPWHQGATESSVQSDARLIERVRIANQDMSDDFEPALKVLATRLATATAALREADEALSHFGAIAGSVAPSWKIGIAAENAYETFKAAIEKARQRIGGEG